MIDLETMGDTPRAPIVALGACRFSRESGVQTHTSFYRTVSLESSMRLGARPDASTILWWMKQDIGAQVEITEAEGDISSALSAFSKWTSETPDLEGVWGNGAAFDNVILGETYRMLGAEKPWPFWLDRCYRTVKSLSPDVPLDRKGTHHNALHDAETQAGHLLRIWAA